MRRPSCWFELMTDSPCVPRTRAWSWKTLPGRPVASPSPVQWLLSRPVSTAESLRSRIPVKTSYTYSAEHWSSRSTTPTGSAKATLCTCPPTIRTAGETLRHDRQRPSGSRFGLRSRIGWERAQPSFCARYGRWMPTTAPRSISGLATEMCPPDRRTAPSNSKRPRTSRIVASSRSSRSAIVRRHRSAETSPRERSSRAATCAAGSGSSRSAAHAPTSASQASVRVVHLSTQRSCTAAVNTSAGTVVTAASVTATASHGTASCSSAGTAQQSSRRRAKARIGLRPR